MGWMSVDIHGGDASLEALEIFEQKTKLSRKNNLSTPAYWSKELQKLWRDRGKIVQDYCLQESVCNDIYTIHVGIDILMGAGFPISDKMRQVALDAVADDDWQYEDKNRKIVMDALKYYIKTYKGKPRALPDSKILIKKAREKAKKNKTKKPSKK